MASTPFNPTGVQRLSFDHERAEYQPWTPPPRFVRPLPYDWLHRCNRLPGRVTQVALGVWFLAGVKRSLTVRLTAEALDLTGCERHTVYRALTVMEEAGLIRVERRSGAYPQVTLLPTALIVPGGDV